MSERRKHLEFLRETARDAIWAGDYERALTLYDDGLALARSWKDRDLEDLFTCNRATTLIEMDRQDFDLSRIKEILLRNSSSPNGVLAAYVAANAHEARAEYGRARFYAQTALQKSRELGLDELTGTSLNLLANLELHESRFEEAESWGQSALALGSEFGRNDVVKNSHYLLAETYSEMGREAEADEHYEALAHYYPDFPELKHYLHQISLMGMINLRA